MKLNVGTYDVKLTYKDHKEKLLTSITFPFKIAHLASGEKKGDEGRRNHQLYSTVTLRQEEKKHYNNKVHVYSFGVVLWELLTNRMPFEGMSNLQAAYVAAFKIIRMLNAFIFTLSPPSPPLAVPNNEPEVATTNNGIISEFSARKKGRFGFLRQLFSLKRTKN
ncbi:hypothetical protein V8G54_008536 [Vigna mungo]|uniref:Serine-threonine/tyrosine-protein kinase catalytic domain-containing protein n=1 Tax=Vigna mungo TaxID=3915 RepID=A0AAQ3SA49_VIGMU